MATLPDATRFYIHGQWVLPDGSKRLDVIDPATEGAIGEVALANNQDVDSAVAAAKSAFAAYSQSSIAQRVAWLGALRRHPACSISAKY